MSYIVPMKKPICINCPFRSLDSCTLIYLMSDKDGEVTLYVNTMTTSPFCPLVEIPIPHGRLIDGDKFYKVMCSHWVLSLGEAYKRLEDFLKKPVIEAEGSEE